ncbi:hypothetical protein Syun_024059 [Stephania yunnanensis]|uniref:Gnk2-homologous domain-containing protein n=1 Tax=Stephania yunnanensis TaxID=152371 RepID=A0AAP0FJ41_9MAGN
MRNYVGRKVDFRPTPQKRVNGDVDRAVCGNANRKNQNFQETTRRAVLDVAMTAPGNGGFARAGLPVQRSGNESVYVLANCWEVLNASSCKACLEKASSLSSKQSKGSNESKKMAKSLYNSSLNFKYSTLEKATVSFDEANKLGQGGFRTVYKRALDFFNEVNIISSLEYKHLTGLARSFQGDKSHISTAIAGTLSNLGSPDVQA